MVRTVEWKVSMDAEMKLALEGYFWQAWNRRELITGSITDGAREELR